MTEVALPRNIFSEIAKRIDDPATWYNYCLTNKMVWNICKYKIRGMQKKVCTEIEADPYWCDPCWEVYQQLPNGNRHGLYRLEYPDDNHEDYNSDSDFDEEAQPRFVVQTGWYNNGKKEGTWKQYSWRSRDVFEECQWENDQKHGQETHYFEKIGPKQIKYQCHWYQDQKVGAETTYNEDGTVKNYQLHSLDN